MAVEEAGGGTPLGLAQMFCGKATLPGAEPRKPVFGMVMPLACAW